MTVDALMSVFGMARASATLTLPFPPSVNHYWRNWQGRMVISAEGRQYRTDCWAECLKSRCARFEKSPLRMAIGAWLPDQRRRDLDNLAKAPLDAMAHAGVYADDSQIHDLRIYRAGIDRKNPRLEITIEAIA